MVWCEDWEVRGGKSSGRQLGLEEKAVDGALVLRWGRERIWVLLSLVPYWQMLQQTGWGDHHWHTAGGKSCVFLVDRNHLSVWLSLSLWLRLPLPPSIFLSVCSSSSSSSFSLYTLSSLLTAAPPTLKSTHRQQKHASCWHTQKLCTQCVHGVQKL